MEISIIAGTIWGNRGGESMVVTTIGKVREFAPDTIFNLFTYYPEEDRRLVQDPFINVIDARPQALITVHFPFAVVYWLLDKLKLKFPEKLLPESVRRLRNSNAMLDVGGVTFIDGRELFLPYNILTIWPAILLKVPVVKLSQAMGPFKSRLNRMLAKYFIGKCDHTFARGQITAQSLAKLKLPGKKWSRSADIAFLYDESFSLSVENDERIEQLVRSIRPRTDPSRKVIALSPSSLVMEKATKAGLEYLETWIDIIREFINQECQFIVLPNATRAGVNSTRNNDLIVVERLQKEVEKRFDARESERITWIDFDVNSRSIRKLISLADVLVTSRFHAMISGLSMEIPTVVVGWSHKYQEALIDFGLEGFAVPFQQADTRSIEIIEQALRSREEIREQLAAKLPEATSLAGIQFQYLKSNYT
jgi:polysaccharide pyruvyl transferase WcaK-like protein